MKPFKKGNFFKLIQNGSYLLVFAIFSFFFYYISKSSPLAGDDWGYAVNGLKQSPLLSAFEFYQNWSGRFFSELYGFVITPHKEIWNILNSTLFSGILALMFGMISKNKRKMMALLIMFFLILTVKDELRMETYTWLMGTTYVIPLFLSLLYLHLIQKILDKPRIQIELATYFLSFYIGLTMENISIGVVFANLVLAGHLFYKTRKISRALIINLMISILSLGILRASPGAALRLTRDHAEWIQLGLFNQLIRNYPNFILMTFIENRFVILSLSLVSVCVLWFKSNTSLRVKSILSAIFIIAIFSTISLQLNRIIPSLVWNMFIDSGSFFNMSFWIFYIIAIYASIWLSLSGDVRDKSIFFVTLAGITNGVMMLSPIFGYRSSLYTVFFLILVIGLMTSEFESNRLLKVVLVVSISLAIGYKVRNLTYKYQLVNRVNNYRLSEIAYYQDHPSSSEAWLIRYPIFTIHSGDIEEYDSYHQMVFKEYYHLNPSMELKFYAPENSYEEYLSQKGW